MHWPLTSGRLSGQAVFIEDRLVKLEGQTQVLSQAVIAMTEASRCRCSGSKDVLANAETGNYRGHFRIANRVTDSRSQSDFLMTKMKSGSEFQNAVDRVHNELDRILTSADPDARKPFKPPRTIRCPLCNSEMKCMHDHPAMRVCACLECGTAVTVPASAW